MEATLKKKNSQMLLQRLKEADETVSIPVFQLSLPKPIEFLLSLPGNLMGPPFVQVVAPMWLFLLIESTQDDKEMRLWLAAAATGLTTLFLLLPFLSFLRGDLKMMSQVLFSHASFGLSPLLGTVVSFYAGPTPYTSGLGYHGIILYCLSCVVILHLKHSTRRLRPCVVFPRCIERKHLVIIPKVLAKHASFTSFPSGDAMGATAWALPLMQLGYPKAAVVLVALTVFGRIFFLAHHLGDTLAGVGVCVGIHTMLGLSQVLPSIGTAEWYHPLMAFVCLLVASQFRKGDQK